MELLLVIVAFILFIIGILGSFIPILPGPPISYLGLLLIHWSGFANFSSAFLWMFAGITVVVTVMDFVLPSLMTKKFGGSRAASIGSFLGIIVGLFFFPPWGIIVGPFLGALIGELITNKAEGSKALKVALGAFLAFLVGSGIKLIISSIMLFYAITALLQ